jgi:glycosyltransferase involved in cell wall biosynthesis
VTPSSAGVALSQAQIGTSSRDKRVLHVLFDPVIGGCESLCIDLVAAFAGRGSCHDVVFLSATEGPAKQRLQQMPGVGVHVCELKSRLTFLKAFAAFCRSHSIDVVINYTIGAQFLVAAGARLGGVARVISCFQNPAPRDHRLRRATWLQAQLARPFVSLNVACTSYVASTIEHAYHLSRRHLLVVPNWCDVSGIARRAAAANRDESRQPGGGPVAGMVARLDPIKDHDTVLRGFSRFLEACPSARLRLIGSGPLQRTVERLAADLRITDRVEFLGSRLDVAEQLAGMDMFVYATTADEGFGIVLAEAMAAGVPIVATDVGPCAEVLDGGRAGLLVPPADPGALAEAMVRLWRDPDLRARLASSGRARARRHFSRESAARRFAELFDA